jgi:hypothetical protein
VDSWLAKKKEKVFVRFLWNLILYE